MVFCSLCKNNKEPHYNWQVVDHGAQGRMDKYRICDDCAVLLLKEMTSRVMGVRDKENLPFPVVLSKTGVISELLLHNDNSLELVIDLDICKARRIIPKENCSKEEAEEPVEE
jgi:hypothetical protein